MARAAIACRLLSFLLLLAVIGGCTLRLTYNYADWLALWQIDRHFDLTGPQRTFLREHLAMVLERHRAESLPAYEQFLGRLQDAFRDGLSREEVTAVFTAYERLRTDLFELLVDSGAAFLASVDRRQIEHVRRRFRLDNESLADDLTEPLEERLIERADATVDWLEGWVGSLSREQEARVRALSLALPDTAAAWLEFRRQRQAALLSLLGRQDFPVATMRREFRDWLVFPERGAPEIYLAERARMRQGVTDMALAIDAMLTTDQRRHLLDELEDLRQDLRGLREA